MTVTIKSMHAGQGVDYLLRTVAVGDGDRSLRDPLTRYYTEEGTPPGYWLGSGVASLDRGLKVGDEVAEEQLRQLIGHGQHPVASRLGFLPHLRTTHTLRRHARQIYLPAVNWTLGLAVLAVVLIFRSSASLASAYGVAVTSTIAVTTLLYLTYRWRRDGRVSPGFLVGAAILVVELVFLAANLPKIRSGGWLPLGMGAILVLTMTTWRAGQRRIEAARADAEGPVEDLVPRIRATEAGLARVPGTAVYLTRGPGVVPIALDAMLDLNHVLHTTTVLLSWESVDVPAVRHDERVVVDVLDDPTDGIVHVHATFGYRERPDLLAVLEQAISLAEGELDHLDVDRAIYFTSVPVVTFSPRSGMPRWRQRIFLTLVRLSPDPVDVLRLPRERTISVGREMPW